MERSAGGSAGGTNGLTLIRRDGEILPISYASGVMIEPGDEIVISTANGGGWGVPASAVEKNTEVSP